jgi:hypothetical protein
MIRRRVDKADPIVRLFAYPVGAVQPEAESPGPSGLDPGAPHAGNEYMTSAGLANLEKAWLSSIRLPPAYPRNATGVISGIA